MSFTNKRLLIFGGGPLQKSLINQANSLGIETIVIDPDPSAIGKQLASHFEVIEGDDFEATCEVVDSFAIDGIITSATDKPLVMMARIAERYKFPFYSVKTAENCTNKSKMKCVFDQNDIRCAKGKLMKNSSEIELYPVIIKPVDNSGSRGVFYCDSPQGAGALFEESLRYSKEDALLCEEVILGAEYSVESLHDGVTSELIAITKKTSTKFPVNVETAHVIPAQLSKDIIKRINALIQEISIAFNYRFCAAHTEIKIFNGTITVIETSPRLGGDYITSHLVRLATGVNLESNLIKLRLGMEVSTLPSESAHSGIFYFELHQGKVTQLGDFNSILSIPEVILLTVDLKVGDSTKQLRNSLDRQGYVILKCQSNLELIETKQRVFSLIKEQIDIIIK